MRRTFTISILAAALASSAVFGLAETPQKPAKKPAHAAKATPAAAKEPATKRASSHSGKAHKAAVKATGQKGQTRAAVSSKETEPVAHSSRKTQRTASSHLSRRQLRRLNAMANEPAHFERASMGREGFFMPAPLKGSYESLVRQNTKSEDEGLERIQDDEDLNDRIAQGFLVAVPVSSALMVNPSLPENRRTCRPWTASFLADLAHDHQSAFDRPLIVSSAVRTVDYQKKLMRVNGNAAAAEGDVASPHLTGGTIDIAKSGMSRKEIAWMRAWLLPLETSGKIDVEEEFRQACFHITVYKSYTATDTPEAEQLPVANESASNSATPGQ